MIYVLYGSDAFSRTEALRTLKRELGVGAEGDTNVTAFDAREATPQEVLAACDTVPFLGERRVVILEGALRQARGGGRRRRSRSAEPETEANGEVGPWGVLVEYAGRMPEQTVLVLVDGESLNKDLLGALNPLAKVTSFVLPKGKDLATWVQARARAMGLSIDARACSLIADRVGSDTWMIASELNKLATYKPGREDSGSGCQGASGGRARSRGVPPGGRRRRRKGGRRDKAAPQHAGERGGTGSPDANDRKPLPAASQPPERWSTQARLDQAIGSRLAIGSPYGLERLLDQVSRYPMERVRWALDRIAQADFDVKQGLYEYEMGLELLVQELAAPDAERRPSQRLSATPAGSSW